MGIKHSLHEFVDENVSVFENEEDFKKYLENSEEETETKD
jgi:hypothetical protein